MSLYRKGIILLFSVVIGMVGIVFISLSSIKGSLIETKKNEVASILTFAKKQVAEQVSKGGKQSEVEQRVIEVLSSYRKGSSYIWANDEKSMARVHVRPDKIGTYQESYTRHVKILKNKEFNFVVGENLKPGANKSVVKVSAITMIPELKWVIGLGVYMDDVEEHYFQLANHLVLLSIGVILTVIIIVTMIVKSIYRSLGGEPSSVVRITKQISDGNLSLHSTENPVHGSILDSVLGMQNNLASMVADISRVSERLNLSTVSLQEGSERRC